MSKKQFFKKFDKIFPLKKDSLKIVVIKDKSSGMCFGTGSIFIEKNKKNMVGHIEDILIMETHQD